MLNNNRILLVDDENDILEFLSYNLKNEGFQVLTCNDGKTALSLLDDFMPNLIVLDVMMPGMDGIETCEQIRLNPKYNNILITFLTARSEDYSQVAGLEAGADDYVSKPFSLDILNARIKTVLRRYHKTDEEDRKRMLHNQNIKINPRSREVVIDGILVSLTYTEFQILHLLMSHPGWVYTRYQIIDKIHGENYPVTDRSIDFQIVGLRKKMMGKGNLIETIRGVGYRFQHHET